MTTGGVQGECNGRLGSPRLQALTDESAAATGHESRVWICVETIERNSSAQAAIHSPTLKLTDFSCWKGVAHVDQAMSYRIAPHSRTILAIFWKNTETPFRDTEQIKRSFNTQIYWNHHRCSSLLAARSSARLPGPQQMLHKSCFYNMSVPLKPLLKTRLWIHAAVQHS